MPKANNVRKKKYFRHTSTFYRRLKQEINQNMCSSVKPSKVSKSTTFVKENSTLIEQEDTIPQTSIHHIDPVKISEALSETSDVQSTQLMVNNDNEYDAPECNNLTDHEQENDVSTQVTLLQQISEWALVHRITHSSLNDLLAILNAQHGINLPSNSRTLLKTPSSVNITQMGNGQVWYNGIKNALYTAFFKIQENIKILRLVFNVDGLPPFRNASIEFWPILMKVDNVPNLKPLVVSIFCGATKPPLHEFLTPFVDELKDLLENGITINGHKAEVQLKYFVCDTPARSFIKGTVGFNSAHGCIKCTVIGEYDRGGRHMSFPRIDCMRRTDESFRNKWDEEHHKAESPLLNLPFDIVKGVIISDSLHLLDLGVMRKCLYGWINGNYNFRTKLSGREIDLLSRMLEDCNNRRPTEIHRAIRNLKCLKFWKGVEFRTFLLYLGPVVLKDFLSDEAYHNFLKLSCAVTILSCNTYLVYTHVAEQLLKDYVEQFKMIYGRDSISSNVHNLCHVVEDVKNFGTLTDISAYPFENCLGQLKLLIRTGNRPLAQIAKRVTEMSKLNCFVSRGTQIHPYVKKENTNVQHEIPSCSKFFDELYVPINFMLGNNIRNKWFLTNSNEIVSMLNATYHQDKICIYGAAIENKFDFFDLPIKSSHLNIYRSNGKLGLQKLYSLSDIKCKLIALKYNEDLVFMPLIHTL